jgi:hypothetical protein
LNWKNSSNSHKQGLRGILIPKGAKCADSAHFAVVLSLRQVVIAETTTVNSTGDARAGSAKSTTPAAPYSNLHSADVSGTESTSEPIMGFKRSIANLI